MTRCWRYMNYEAVKRVHGTIQWREHRRVIKELNQLTNRELNDIGTNRGDIDQSAVSKIIKKVKEKLND